MLQIIDSTFVSQDERLSSNDDFQKFYFEKTTYYQLVPNSYYKLNWKKEEEEFVISNNPINPNIVDVLPSIETVKLDELLKILDLKVFKTDILKKFSIPFLERISPLLSTYATNIYNGNLNIFELNNFTYHFRSKLGRQ